MSIAIQPGVWNWKYAGGEFEVNFVQGGEFVCVSYPAHAHWYDIGGSRVHVDWAKFGKYDMLCSSATEMKGNYVGHLDDWRTGTFVRAHTAEENAKFAADAAHAHDHSHEHVHTSECNH